MKIISSGTHAPDFAKHCWRSQEEYAKRIGVEWVRLREPQATDPFRNRLISITQALADSPDDEMVLWLDWDVVISPSAPDIRDFVDPADGIALYNWREEAELDKPARPGVKHLFNLSPIISPFESDKEYPFYNIGVHFSKIATLRQMIPLFSRPDIAVSLANPSREEDFSTAILFELAFNAVLNVSGIGVVPLPVEFHSIDRESRAVDWNGEGAWFHHAAGEAKYPNRKPHYQL